MLFQLPAGEEASRAAGGSVDLAVEHDIGPTDPKLLLQRADQPDHCTHLLDSEGALGSVSNQADPDRATRVDGGTRGEVRSGQLLIPPIPDVDLAVTKPIAIADDKVIPQPIQAATAVPPVHRLWRTRRGAQVMEDDRLPPAAIDGIGEFNNRCGRRRGRQ